jgi:uncharacterized membrane-anchored protein
VENNKDRCNLPGLFNSQVFIATRIRPALEESKPYNQRPQNIARRLNRSLAVKADKLNEIRPFMPHMGASEIF